MPYTHAQAESLARKRDSSPMQDEIEPGSSAAPGTSPERPSTRLGLARARAIGSAHVALSPQEAAKMVEQFRELCRTKGEQLEALDQAAKALRESGYKQELTHVLREAVTWPDSHPHVGALWARRLVSSNNWDRTYPAMLDELCGRGEIGRHAVIEFLQAVAAKDRPELVRQTVRKHAGWLHQEAAGWPVAAQALVKVRLYGIAARWVSDWRSRGELDLPLLHSVALALRGAGREREAHEVVLLALSKPNAEQQFPVLKLWCAQEEALKGDTEVASTQLKDVRPVGWEADSVVLFYLTRGMVRVQRAEPQARSEAFAAAVDRVRDQFRRHKIYEREVMLRRQYRRCMSRMARDSGRWMASLAGAWRSADRCSTLLFLLLIPGLQLFAPLYVFRLCTNRRGRDR